MDETELTEMHEIRVTRQDGVRTPASGVTFLMMKSTAAEPPTESEPATVTDATPATKDAPEGVTETPAATVPQTSDESLSKDTVAKMIADAVEAEVSKAVEERTKALTDELAVLKATPIPGGPLLTAPASARQDVATDAALAKAVYHERQADLVNDRELKQYHTAKAKALRAALA